MKKKYFLHEAQHVLTIPQLEVNGEQTKTKKYLQKFISKYCVK